MTEPNPELWARYTREVGELRDRLRAVPLDDRDTWATVARQTAGAFAAWSHAIEPVPGDLAAAADELAKSAQTYRRPVRPIPAGRVAMSGASMLLASAVRGGQGVAAQVALLRQLMNLSQAVYDAAKAAGEARHAAAVATVVRDRITVVSRQLEADATRMRQVSPESTGAPDKRAVIVDEAVRDALAKMQTAEQRREKTTGSPLPERVQPAKPRTPGKGRNDHGPER